jgi:hypothetical protein
MYGMVWPKINMAGCIKYKSYKIIFSKAAPVAAFLLLLVINYYY